MLSSNRKSDRPEMLLQLVELVSSFGGAARICRKFNHDPTCDRVELQLSLADTHVMLIKGLKQFVYTWSSRAPFVFAFGDVNPYHRRKANRHVLNFEELLKQLRWDCEQLRSGEAFAITPFAYAGFEQDPPTQGSEKSVDLQNRLLVENVRLIRLDKRKNEQAENHEAS